jgi:hypothetical protein
LFWEQEDFFEQHEVVVTLKNEGESFVGYPNFSHGRFPTNELPKAINDILKTKLPVLDEEMCILGQYKDDVLQLQSIWVENYCLDWEETKDIADLMGLPMSKVIYEGIFDKKLITECFSNGKHEDIIGYNIRLKDSFKMFDIYKSMAGFEE